MASKIKVDQIAESTSSANITFQNDVIVPTGKTITIADGVPVASGGTGLASFTAGDVLYATGPTTLAKLAKGTAEQVLAMNAGATAPDWGSVDLTVLPTITVAKGGTGQAGGFTQGDFLYATDATTLAKLAKGTASQQLAMNAGATAPEWITASGGGVLQFKQTLYQTNTNYSSSVSYLYLTGLTLTITPTLNTSKILLRNMLSYGGANNNYAAFCIYRDIGGAGYSQLTGALGEDTSNNRVRAIFAADTGSGDNDNYKQFSASSEYLDAPATVSAVTYRLYYKANQILNINYDNVNSDHANYHNCSSSMSATELAVGVL